MDSLHQAVSSCNVIKVREILRRDSSSVDDWNFESYTPLMQLIHSQHTNPAEDVLIVMKLLLDYGANVNACGGRSLNSALHFAVVSKQINLVEFLLKNGADPNIRNEFYRTPLFYAADENNEIIVELLLNYNADPNISDFNGNTPLDCAVLSCSEKSAWKLVAFGAKSNNVYKILCRACCHISIEGVQTPRYKMLVTELLRHGAEINISGNFSLNALMYYLVSEKHKVSHIFREVKCFLLESLNEQGIAVDVATGDSELHLAVRAGDCKKVKSLLRKGEDINVKNLYGDTPLHLAFKEIQLHDKERYMRIARLLIEHGADLRAPNYLDETPFFLNTHNEKDTFVRLMLEKITGVDGTAFEKIDDTLMNFIMDKPMDDTPMNRPSIRSTCLSKHAPELHELLVVIDSGYEQVVDRLLDMDFINEASKNCQYVNGALRAAVGSNQYNMVKMLLEAGFRSERHYDSYTPRGSDFHEFDMRMLCLFWEFKDYATLNRWILSFCRYEMKLPPELFSPPEHTSTAVYLPIFYYVIYLRSNILNPDLVPVRGVFKSNRGLSKILSICNEKLDELKKIKLRNKSMYDILTMPLNLLVKLLNSNDYLEDCRNVLLSLEKKKKLEYYECALKTRIELAMEKVLMVNIVRYNLSKALEGILETRNLTSLPDEILWDVIFHCNIRELKKMAINNSTPLITPNTSKFCVILLSIFVLATFVISCLNFFPRNLNVK